MRAVNDDNYNTLLDFQLRKGVFVVVAKHPRRTKYRVMNGNDYCEDNTVLSSRLSAIASGHEADKSGQEGISLCANPIQVITQISSLLSFVNRGTKEGYDSTRDSGSIPRALSSVRRF